MLSYDKLRLSQADKLSFKLTHHGSDPIPSFTLHLVVDCPPSLQ